MSSSSTQGPAQTFEIISSLRYDPALPTVVSQHAHSSYPEPHSTPYYLLAYHRDRLIAAAQHFQWKEALHWLQRDLNDFEQFLDASIPDRNKRWRLRIALDSNGKATVEVNGTAAIDPLNLLVPSAHANAEEESLWRVYIDSQSTMSSGLTTHKTTARENYAAARLRAGISSPAETAEVLIINPNGEIMEGSITTPYFRRRETRSDQKQDEVGPVWITPPLSSGGNAGTTRRYALSQEFCVEQIITQADLVDGEECWLSNGVRGFMRGRVILKR